MDNQLPALPYEQQLRLVIRDEVLKLIETHELRCPFTADEYPKRLRRLESNWATLVGLLIGSGVLGGAIGAQLSALL